MPYIYIFILPAICIYFVTFIHVNPFIIIMNLLLCNNIFILAKRRLKLHACVCERESSTSKLFAFGSLSYYSCHFVLVITINSILSHVLPVVSETI